MNVAILVIIGFLVVFGLRELVCWYFKINERLILQHKQMKLAEETNFLLRKLLLQSKGEKDVPYISVSEGVELELSDS